MMNHSLLAASSAQRVPILASRRPTSRGRAVPAVSASTGSLFQLADAAQTAATQVAAQAASTPPPGSVDAPVWVIVASAVVVTVALSASSFLLKPGDSRTLGFVQFRA